MHRIIFFTNERDPAVSAKWPCDASSVFEAVQCLNRLAPDAVDRDESYFVIPEHHLGATVKEFYAWMTEHCPCAIHVNRSCPNTEKFTYEWLITDPDQAFAYKMRWGPCVLAD